MLLALFGGLVLGVAAVLGKLEVLVEHLLAQLVDSTVAVVLAVDLACLDEVVVDRRLDGVHHVLRRQAQFAEALLGGVAFGAKLLDQVDDRQDALVVAELQGLDEVGLGDLRGTDLDHVDSVLVAGEDEIKIAEIHLGLGGVEDELCSVIGVDAGDANGGDGSFERGVGDVRRGRSSAASHDVGIVLAVV